MQPAALLARRVWATAAPRAASTALRTRWAARSALRAPSRLALRAMCAAAQPDAPEPRVARDQATKMSFQAETRQLLDIVTHSIYKDKEVFLRELISNASDALEKARHLQVSGKALEAPETPLEIRISVDSTNKTVTLEDSGIGMTREELVDHLGTIARSGSKQFLNRVREEGGGDVLNSLIGQFGVGFYSSFMVADKVEVFTKPAEPGMEPHYWTSSGVGEYEIAPVDSAARGTRVVLHLKESCHEFADETNIESIIKKYSNFVNYPILLNGKRVNTISALWLHDPKSVKPEQYTEFYKFIANAFDSNLYTLHFTADAPISLRTLLFVGETQLEKYGLGRLENGVNLYSRKVLIEGKSAHILPEWLRFVRGVVDSEDIPLSLSREGMQDSRLMQKIRDVLTRRLLRYFDEQSKTDPGKFTQFVKEYSAFFKEGIVTEQSGRYKELLARLLRFQSSARGEEELVSLDDYMSRQPPERKEIYYLCAPSRSLAEQSPYYETFKKKGVEVLFMVDKLDELVMMHLEEYSGRKLISAEAADLKVEGVTDDATAAAASHLSKEECDALAQWLTEDALKDRIAGVKTTLRLEDSPAIVTQHDGMQRRLSRAMFTRAFADDYVHKEQLEINPAHPIIKNLAEQRLASPSLARDVAEQVYFNALIAAGLLDDPRMLLPRLNRILQKASALKE